MQKFFDEGGSNTVVAKIVALFGFICWDICSHGDDLGWELLSNSLRSDLFLIFQHYQNTSYLLNNTFVFGRCCRSSAAATHVKYENNSNIYLVLSQDRKFHLRRNQRTEL